MSFLWLTRFPPFAPLHGGAIQYSRELLHSLSQHAPVHALAFEHSAVAMPPDDPVSWELVPYRRPSRIRGLMSNLPDVAFRFRSRRYLRRAVELAKSSQGIVIDFIGMAWLVEPLQKALLAAGAEVPVVMVTHNHERSLRRGAAASFAFPMNLVIGFDAWKAGRLELRANSAADGITAIIDEDAIAFASESQTPITVLRPGYRGPIREQRLIDISTPRVATILGNRDSAHKVATLEHALAALDHAGTSDSIRIEICGAGSLTALRDRYAKFAFRGFEDDLPAYLKEVRLGLVPDDLGGGFKMRVLTLAMLRVPILGLRSAMTGTTFEPGKHYVAVETLDEMATALSRLIDDLPLLNRLQDAAFEHCKSNFDWSDRGRALATFLQDLGRRSELRRA